MYICQMMSALTVSLCIRMRRFLRSPSPFGVIYNFLSAICYIISTIILRQDAQIQQPYSKIDRSIDRRKFGIGKMTYNNHSSETRLRKRHLEGGS